MSIPYVTLSSPTTLSAANDYPGPMSRRPCAPRLVTTATCIRRADWSVRCRPIRKEWRSTTTSDDRHRPSRPRGRRGRVHRGEWRGSRGEAQEARTGSGRRRLTRSDDHAHGSSARMAFARTRCTRPRQPIGTIISHRVRDGRRNGRPALDVTPAGPFPQALAQRLIHPACLQSFSNNFALHSRRRLGAPNNTPEGAPFQTTPIR
jgi:hypothetical protein